MLRSALSVFALTAVLAMPALAADETADTVVATVNGEDITLGQILLMKQGVPAQMLEQMPDQAVWDLLLDQAVRQASVAQAGAQNPTPRDIAAMALDQRAYYSSRALEKVAEPAPTEEEITAAYNTTFDPAAEPVKEYHAAHILLETEDAAEAVKAELDGGTDFAQVAREKSTDPAGVNGGDLGWFTLDRMVQPFSDAVKEMAEGQISDPVQSQFGWHIIKLEGQRDQARPELEAVREQLDMQIRRERVEAAIQKLVSDAKVTRMEGLDPVLVTKTDLLGD
ncbi:MAG: peptidylprolyl isomerase [Paracoccus sp. (in: a-proteobacteria)]|nr:peptidylprolyl isomerase [Paracoccus sp. (in: a-proteobacteria)]